MKEIGNYFKIHYSVVSRIIAVNKKKIMQNERPDPHDPAPSTYERDGQGEGFT
jgi:hypothetical protein